jgi:DNA (cytosine-5)-methyltransferase 1
MVQQLNLFEGFIPRYTINKPIRLIEMFAGIGSQYQALKNLGANVEHHRIVEWQVNSIQTYNDIHIQDYKNYSEKLTDSEVIDKLVSLGVSTDYNAPMTFEQVKRKGSEWARKVYNNVVATKNLVNISSVKGEDLAITDTDKYDYVLTYSFPCQDLSLAGKSKGMSRNSGTRSGLLWEVERILKETKQLPKVLLMENVPEVIGSNFIKDFQEWEAFLTSLGYSNHTEILNAKHYGIPQNRQRAFMVSILGNYLYNFPQKIALDLRLRDMLEENVDEKFYLSEDILSRISNWNSYQNPLDKTLGKDSISPTITTRIAESIDGGINASMVVLSQDLDQQLNTRDLFKSKDKRLPKMLEKIDFDTDEPQSLDLYNRTVSDISQTLTLPNHNAQAIAVKELNLHIIANVSKNGRENGNIYNSDGLSPTLCARDYKDPKKVTNNLRIRKLTPKECYRLMGFSDQAFDLAQANQSNSTLYHQAGDSIVVNVLMAIFKELL